MTTSAIPEPVRLARTALYDFHLAHGAHMVPFSGWEMPLYFRGILEEHRAVRSAVGLFDVSHMGILTVTGEHAATLLARRTTANVPRMAPGQCKYSFWLNSEGQILDDLLLTRLDDGRTGPPSYLVIPNAGRADRVFELLEQHRWPDTTVLRHNPGVAILAVQGPRSRALLETLFGLSLGGLRFYTARAFPAAGAAGSAGRIGFQFPDGLTSELLVSRTGYTGELGYELLVPAVRAPELAEKILGAGATACGLGARDTLRLEKGYLLSGNEFRLDRSPLEAGQERFVEPGHPFVGEAALEAQRSKGLVERLAGLSVETPGAIPRHGTLVLDDGQRAGVVTSGGLSPTLGHGIALAYLPTPLGEVGTELEVAMRDRVVPARVVPLPFVPAPGRPD